MKTFFKIIAILLIFLFNVTFFPRLYLGLLVAILINIFYSTRQSYLFAIAFGIFYDIYMIRIFGISTTLVFLLVVKSVELLISYKKRAKNEFIDYLLATLTVVILLNVDKLFLYSSWFSVREIFWMVVYNLLATVLIYGVWIRLEKHLKSRRLEFDN